MDQYHLFEGKQSSKMRRVDKWEFKYVFYSVLGICLVYLFEKTCIITLFMSRTCRIVKFEVRMILIYILASI